MVRRLRVESDARQLGLFGEGLALGIRPKAATIQTRPCRQLSQMIAAAR
jgi:hypothetical protein